ncbi:hypothetical protein PS1_029634 [Malus domestica]
MGLRRSVRLNATISGATPPPRVSTTVATSLATRGEVHGAFTTARAVPSKAHGTKATTQAMSLQAQRELNALPSQAQASHLCASHSEQPTLAAQPTLVAQPAPDGQPTPVVQPASTEQLTLAAQPASTEQLTLAAQPALMAQPALVAQPTSDEQPTLAAQPALMAQPAPATQSAPVDFQAAQVGPRLSQLFRLTIESGAFSPYFFTDLTFPNLNLAHGVYHPSTA